MGEVFVDRIEKRLRSRGLWHSSLRERVAEFERLCVLQIGDPVLRDALVAFLLEEAPPEFYLSPASELGGHHPSWQNEAGGILLNTVECCIAIDRKIRMYPSLTDANGNAKPYDRDVIYIATILSDTFKVEDYGRPWSEWRHHERAAEAWERFVLQRKLDRKWLGDIKEAILWHLGRFTPRRETEIKDPRLNLSLHAFLTHELDMDFANRALDQVFYRKGFENARPDDDGPAKFVLQELASTTTYFSQVETKMVSLVTLYSTLVVASVPGATYIVTNSAVQQLSIPYINSTSLVLLGLFLGLFSVVGTCLLAIYMELRVRKITMLEAMASARAFLNDAAKRGGVDLSSVITTVVGVRASPKFLRRPSEDWYMAVLMSALGGVFWAAAAFSLAVGLATDGAKSSSCFWIVLLIATVVAGVLIAVSHLGWAVRFAYEMDLRREEKHGQSTYTLLPDHSATMPAILRPVSRMSACLENRYRRAQGGGQGAQTP